MSGARQFLQIPGTFEMRRGGTLERPVVAYETWGQLNAARDNAVLIFTGLSPSAHASSSPQDPAPGWWEEIVGPSRPIDTRRYFVMCVNSLGSCFGSTGPASVNPQTGAPYRLGFPVLTLEDVAVAGRRVVEHLGIRVLHTLVGPSMGGMTSLGYAALFPGTTRRLVLLSCGARSLPFAVALRSLQREMIRRDPGWAGGNYEPGAGPISGMRLARKLGMITYRSAQEWEQRFGRERIPEERQTGRLPSRWISRSRPTWRPTPGSSPGSSTPTATFTCHAPATCSISPSMAARWRRGSSGCRPSARWSLAWARTSCFPIHQQRELAAGLRAGCAEVTFEELPSIQGHDSFLVDMDRFRPVIEAFFQGP